MRARRRARLFAYDPSSIAVVDGGRWVRLSSVMKRRNELVATKFSRGLTPDEHGELAELRERLDDVDKARMLPMMTVDAREERPDGWEPFTDDYDYDKAPYEVLMRDGSAVQCWPNAGLMNALDGSGRMWGPDEHVLVRRCERLTYPWAMPGEELKR